MRVEDVMDRRTFLAAGAGLPALSHAMPWFGRDGKLRDPKHRVLFIVDSTLPATQALQAAWGFDGRDAIEVGADVGALWYARLRDWPGVIRGSLRPSDYFVLRNLSVGGGRVFRSLNVGHGAIAFIIGVG
jgi:hypothetical protein